MERRSNPILRNRVEQVLISVRKGRVSIEDAGRRMDRLGVPFAVACRVLSQSGKPTGERSAAA